MKKWAGPVVSFTLVFFMFTPTLGLAEEQAPREAENEVSIDAAMPLFFGLTGSEDSSMLLIPIYLDYQRVIARHLVISIAPSILYIRRAAGDWSLLGTLWMELDWHPFQNGLRGFFLGPAVAATFTRGRFGDTSTEIGGAVGATVGYQVLLPASIDIDIAVGLGAGYFYDTNDGTSFFGGLPRLVLAVGYRF